MYTQESSDGSPSLDTLLILSTFFLWQPKLIRVKGDGKAHLRVSCLGLKVKGFGVYTIQFILFNLN